MTYSILKNHKLSGTKASIYSIYNEDEKETLLDRFIRENNEDSPEEVIDIIKRIKTIGHQTGARETFFKPHEGKGGDGVCALFDTPNKNLRLYCILNGRVNVIIGSGGEKPKTMRTLQESPKLTEESYFLRAVSQLLYQRIKNKEIRYSPNGMDLEGDLTFEDADLKY